MLLHFYPWLSWITKHAATALLMALSRTGSDSAAKLEETFLYTLLTARVMDCIALSPEGLLQNFTVASCGPVASLISTMFRLKELSFSVQCLVFMSCVACTFAGRLSWYTQRHVILVGHEKRTWHKTALK